VLTLREWYMHPNGQLPRTSFPRRRQPARARLGRLARLQDDRQRGKRDSCFLGALLPEAPDQLHVVGEPQGRRGKNIFGGGFLGLDNIGIFDRSKPLPGGGVSSRRWHGVDGILLRTMLSMALELARVRPVL
jgi:hypothetical protein